MEACDSTQLTWLVRNICKRHQITQQEDFANLIVSALPPSKKATKSNSKSYATLRKNSEVRDLIICLVNTKLRRRLGNGILGQRKFCAFALSKIAPLIQNGHSAYTRIQVLEAMKRIDGYRKKHQLSDTHLQMIIEPESGNDFIVAMEAFRSPKGIPDRPLEQRDIDHLTELRREFKFTSDTQNIGKWLQAAEKGLRELCLEIYDASHRLEDESDSHNETRDGTTEQGFAADSHDPPPSLLPDPDYPTYLDKYLIANLDGRLHPSAKKDLRNKHRQAIRVIDFIEYIFRRWWQRLTILLIIMTLVLVNLHWTLAIVAAGGFIIFIVSLKLLAIYLIRYVREEDAEFALHTKPDEGWQITDHTS